MCSLALTLALACRQEQALPHTQGLLSLLCTRALFFPASQSFSSIKFSSVPADPSAREGPPPLLCREPHGSFLGHPCSTHLRNQMTQPLSLAHPGLQKQTTSQRTHSCSLAASSPGALFQPVPMPEELRGTMSKADGSQWYRLSIPSRPREPGRSPAGG